MTYYRAGRLKILLTNVQVISKDVASQGSFPYSDIL